MLARNFAIISLQRVPMHQKAAHVRPIPPGYNTVSPWIVSRNTARLLDFMKTAFGAEELGRVPNGDGTIGHPEARIGDSVFLMFDAKNEWPDTPAFLRLYVADADVVYRKALSAGATVVTEVTPLYFGDRVGRVRDPLGNIWWIQTHVEDVAPDELSKRAQKPANVDAMRRVEESLDHEIRRIRPQRP
jgi:PhnB protein